MLASIHQNTKTTCQDLSSCRKIMNSKKSKESMAQIWKTILHTSKEESQRKSKISKGGLLMYSQRESPAKVRWPLNKLLRGDNGLGFKGLKDRNGTRRPQLTKVSPKRAGRNPKEAVSRLKSAANYSGSRDKRGGSKSNGTYWKAWNRRKSPTSRPDTRSGRGNRLSKKQKGRPWSPQRSRSLRVTCRRSRRSRREPEGMTAADRS